MAIFNRLSKEEIKARFTHGGFVLFAPVYMDLSEHDCAYVEAQNWIPEWWVHLNVRVLRVLSIVAQYIFWDMPPGFPVWKWRLA